MTLPLDLSFCPVLKRIIETGKSQASDGSDVTVSGLSTINNLRILRGLLADEPVQDTLEIGLAYAASALTILATQAQLSKATYRHRAIDPFQSSSWKNAGVIAIQSAGYENNFLLVEEMSSVALPRLLGDGKLFDLIYIDGSHLFEDVFVDLYYSCHLVREGGFIVFDDCTDRHVDKVIRFVERNYGGILERHDVSKYKERTLKSFVARITDRQQAKAYRKVGKLPREWNAPFHRF
jgi:predicted O-methyltransferase YrrM